MKNHLDPRPARELTDREISKLLGAIIAGLMTMATADTVRSAMRWWVESDAAWESMERSLQIAGDALRMARETPGQS